MMPYLGICSLIGELSVSCTQGLGASIVTSIRGDNQFKNWFIYFLLAFVVVTLLTEINYLNVALAMFNTVTPTYYITCKYIRSFPPALILYQGLKASASQNITIVLAFAVICTGIIILQMTKVDPRTLTNVDEHTTLLLEAARQEVDPFATNAVELAPSGTLRSRRSRISQRSRRMRSHTAGAPEAGDGDAESDPTAARSTDDLETGLRSDAESDLNTDLIDEKRAIVAKTEEPGLDSLRMTGGAIGTIIRARRRATALSAASATRSRFSQLSSTNGAGSVHSGQDRARGGGTQRSSLSPAPTQGTRPSWFKALTARRTADSDAHDGCTQSRSPQPHPPPNSTNGVELSEKAHPSISTTEVSGLPSTISESPLSSMPRTTRSGHGSSAAEGSSPRRCSRRRRLRLRRVSR
ncbi:DUF803-domain-containing protein [Trametes cingulata]|nr:DUF803-domain-containing protein [Trametes cingulata]